MQAVFTGLKKIIDAGYVKPGGAGTQFTAAQAQWSNAQDFILYPSGGWIENEMKKDTKEGFKMTGAPEPTVTSGSKMPWEALHSTAGEGYIVPSKAKNPAGGKEFLRAMLSNEAAVNFAKTKFASTIVKDTIPADGFGSTALVSQVKLLEDAGDEHLLLELRRPLRHQRRPARGVEHVPAGRLRRGDADLRAAGHHGQGGQRPIGEEGHSQVTVVDPGCTAGRR